MKAIQRLWQFLSSIRLAFVLILILICLGLIGALLIQVPSDVASDPAVYQFWLEHVARPKVGPWVYQIASLGFFDVFHSYWFLFTCSLLIVNILVCSLNRWHMLSSIARGGLVKQDEAFFFKGRNRVDIGKLSLPSSSLTDMLRDILQKHHYRIRVEDTESGKYLAADKNRFFAFGTYFIHLSLLLLVVGVLISSYMGFRDSSFIVPEGTVRQVRDGTNLSLRLDSFTDDYWPDGTPRDFKSQVVIYENGEEVIKQDIRVNHPLSYKGIRFYQSFFGPAVSIQVKNKDGAVIFDDYIALSEPFNSQLFQGYAGSFTIPQTGLIVRLIDPIGVPQHPVIQENELILDLYTSGSMERLALTKLTQGEPIQLGDLEFAFIRKAQYSGFQVSSDPGVSIIWIASTLFLLGLVMTLYFPPSQIRALIKPDDSGGSHLLVKPISLRRAGMTQFQIIVRDIKIHLAREDISFRDEEL